MYLKICPHGFPKTNCEICRSKMARKYHLAHKGERKTWTPPPNYKKFRPEIWNTAIIKKYLVHYDKNNIITKYVLLDARKPD